jgi:competence protein ComEC
LFANPLILPVQPPLMILGGVSVLVGMIYRPVGQLLAYLAWPFVAYTIRTVEWLSGMPGGVINLGRTALPVVIVFYLLLFAWTFAHARIAPALQKAGIAINLKPAIPLTALALLIVITWRSAFSAPDGRLHVTVLDVGTGEAILIQTPGGRNILVDGGPSASRLSEALGRRLPPGNRRLDWLVIASPDEDGLTALPRMIERYPPDNVLWAGPTHGTYPSRQLWEALILRDIPVTLAKPGQALDLGQGAFLRFLTVGSRGAVLLLEWENFRLLLPLGLDFEALEGLKNGNAVGPVTALLLSESGYAPLNPPEWLAALRPQVVLLSVAADDRQGLPDTEVLQALEGYTLLRTDENGWIKLTTDGKILLTEVERR